MEAGSGTKYIKYVKKYHKAHPDLTWKQAMKKASKSYHQLHGNGAPIRSMAEPSKESIRDMMLLAQGAAWPGDISGHRKAALKGWKHRKAAKKRSKKGGVEAAALHDLPLVGPILGLFGLGKDEDDKLPKKLMKHYAMMKDLLASGVLAGSGYETHARMHSAAVKKMMNLIAH